MGTSAELPFYHVSSVVSAVDLRGQGILNFRHGS